MEYKIITDEQGFLNEKETWNSICKAMPDSTPFQTWEWSYIWWKNNEPEDSLHIIVAFDGKTIFGYAPIVVKNNCAEFIGGRDMDYGAFVVAYKTVEVINGFLETLFNSNYSLALQEMPSMSEQIHITEKFLEKKKRFIKHKTTRTAYIDVKKYDSFDMYYKQISGNMRNKTNKLLRKAEKEGLVVKKEIVTEEVLNEIENIYKIRQIKRGGAADITWSFEEISGLTKEGIAEVYMARKAEDSVAFLVCLKTDDTIYTWLMAITAEAERLFPGQLLNYTVIKEAFDNNLLKIDFMRGDYDFKMRWGTTVSTNYTMFVYKNWVNYKKSKMWFAIRPKLRDFLYNHESLKKVYKKHA